MKSIKGLILTLGLLSFVVAGVQANSTTDKITNDIFEAIRSIDYTSINVLLNDGINVDTVDQDGNTPLMAAAKIGNPRIVDIILSHNPSINAQNKSGNTALTIAAQTGQLYIVKQLVAQGADVSIRNNEGYTALTLASKFGHDEIVSFLHRGDANKLHLYK